jgi:hypothetical protein
MKSKTSKNKQNNRTLCSTKKGIRHAFSSSSFVKFDKPQSTQEKQNLKLSSPNPSSSHLSLFFSPCSSSGSQIRLKIEHGKQQPQKNKNKKRNTKKNETNERLLSPRGWLTHGRGEKRREEMKLCSSSPSFCAAAQVREELCKGADEKEREREGEKSGRQESGLKVK